jgi:hypothetical protein
LNTRLTTFLQSSWWRANLLAGNDCPIRMLPSSRMYHTASGEAGNRTNTSLQANQPSARDRCRHVSLYWKCLALVKPVNDIGNVRDGGLVRDHEGSCLA